MELWCQNLCLLKDIQFHSMLFLQTTALFSYFALVWHIIMQPHLNYSDVKHTVEQFHSEYVVNVKITFYVVQRERFRFCFCSRNEL